MTYRCPLCKRTHASPLPEQCYCGTPSREFEADEPAPETQPSPMFVPWPGREGAR